jgi:UPF0716 protein FxsA
VVAKLFILFLVVPVIEIALMLTIGAKIGVWMTLLIIVATAVLGASLAHREGLKTWWRIRDKLASGVMPEEELVDGLMILIASAVLLTPGFFTDAVGFLLLTPRVRQVIKRWLWRKFSQRIDVPFREL